MKILGEIWSVEVREEDNELETRFAGMTRYRERRFLLIKQNEQLMKKTMLHELIHVIFDRAGLERNDESNVCRVEHIMWAIMADNKEMMAWILS